MGSGRILHFRTSIFQNRIILYRSVASPALMFLQNPFQTDGMEIVFDMMGKCPLFNYAFERIYAERLRIYRQI